MSTYNKFGGVDISAIFKNRVIAKIPEISYKVTRQTEPWSHPMPLRKVHVKDIRKEPTTNTGCYKIAVEHTPEIIEVLRSSNWALPNNFIWQYLHFWSDWTITTGDNSFHTPERDIEEVELIWGEPPRKVYIDNIDQCGIRYIHLPATPELLQALGDRGYTWGGGTKAHLWTPPNVVEGWLICIDTTWGRKQAIFHRSPGKEEEGSQLVEIILKQEKTEKSKPFNRFDYCDLD